MALQPTQPLTLNDIMRELGEIKALLVKAGEKRRQTLWLTPVVFGAGLVGAGVTQTPLVMKFVLIILGFALMLFGWSRIKQLRK